MAQSGQITVATVGTAVQGTDQSCSLVSFKAHPDNTDTVWIGEDGAGDVSSSNGYPLDPGEQIILQVPGDNLSTLWFDADVNGEKICWLRLC